MKSSEFGARLRELRKKAGLSQRELADRIGVNYSYLSKIESQVMPPPSQQVIVRLAEVLDADRDEMLILAGKIPADIAQILKNQKVVQLLRSDKRIKRIGTAGQNEGSRKMKSLMKWKTLTRVALPLMLVMAVAASLWYAAPLPVKALTISFPSLPTTGTLGNSYTFTVKVNVETQDLLPMHSIDLLIRNKANPGTYTASAIQLPIPGTGLTSASKSFSSSQTGGGAISATASTAYGWTWSSGGRTGYGYRDPAGMGYHTMPATFGYGYGYDFDQGNTYISYTITWTPPSNWPAGSYDIITYVYGDAAKTKKWSGTSNPFTLSVPVAAEPSPLPPPVTVTTVGDKVTTNVRQVVNSDGVFAVDVAIESADNQVSLEIASGTVGLTEAGDRLTAITIEPLATPPPPPADANIIGLTYDFGPDGATFNPPIPLTFTYELDDIPEGVNEEDLVIAIWTDLNDADSGEWVVLEGVTVDPVTRTVSVDVSHFTEFTIIGRVTPEPVEPVEEPVEPVVEPEEPVEEPVEPVVEPVEPVEEPVEPVEEPVEPVVEPEQPAEPEEPSAGILWWVWVVIAAVVVAVAGYFLWWRRRL